MTVFGGGSRWSPAFDWRLDDHHRIAAVAVQVELAGGHARLGRSCSTAWLQAPLGSGAAFRPPVIADCGVSWFMLGIENGKGGPRP
jgi:hypothetical protein